VCEFACTGSVWKRVRIHVRKQEDISLSGWVHFEENNNNDNNMNLLLDGTKQNAESSWAYILNLREKVFHSQR
jgi:hypothetical protein